MNIPSLITNVYSGEDQIWTTKNSSDVSYTKDGHDLIKESEQNSFWFSHRLDALNEVFDKFPTASLLDIGGGNGQISLYLQQKGVDVALVEPRLSGAKNANNAGLKQVINSRFDDLDIQPNSIDAFSAFDVLEHIDKDLVFLKKLNAKLKRDGKLYLTVPAYNFLYSNFDKEVGHYRRYSLNLLEQKLKFTGFKVNYTSYLFYPLPLPIFIARRFYSNIKNNQDRRKFGHINKRNTIGSLMKILLYPERMAVKAGMRIPFGTSCLVVASKEKDA